MVDLISVFSFSRAESCLSPKGVLYNHWRDNDLEAPSLCGFPHRRQRLIIQAVRVYVFLALVTDPHQLHGLRMLDRIISPEKKAMA